MATTALNGEDSSSAARGCAERNEEKRELEERRGKRIWKLQIPFWISREVRKS